MAKLSRKKAKEMLRHGSVRGHKLTKKQKGFFGARVAGLPVKLHNPGPKVRDEMTEIP